MPVIGSLIHSNRCTSGLYKTMLLISSGNIDTGIIIEEKINNAVKNTLCKFFRKTLSTR